MILREKKTIILTLDMNLQFQFPGTLNGTRRIDTSRPTSNIQLLKDAKVVIQSADVWLARSLKGRSNPNKFQQTVPLPTLQCNAFITLP